MDVGCAAAEMGREQKHAEWRKDASAQEMQLKGVVGWDNGVELLGVC